MADYVTLQKKLKKDISEEFNNGYYPFENPYVRLNPFLISPLTAIIMFKTEYKCFVKIAVMGRDKYSTVEHTFDNMAYVHSIPVYGLYPDKVNEVKIMCVNEKNQEKVNTVYIRTAPLPSDFTYVKIDVCEKS